MYASATEERTCGIPPNYSISVSLVFFFASFTSPDVRDLFTFGLGELIAPVED